MLDCRTDETNVQMDDVISVRTAQYAADSPTFCGDRVIIPFGYANRVFGKTPPFPSEATGVGLQAATADYRGWLETLHASFADM